MRYFLVILLLLPAHMAHAALTVTDDLGRRLTLPRPPRRIISLAPSVTEILFAVGAGRKIAADTVFCDYPEAAKNLPHVGGPMTPNAEKILALKPDLIVLADQTIPRAEADRLAVKWHVPVYVTAAATYRAVEQDIAALGALAGEPKATQDTLARMRAAENAVQKAVRGHRTPTVFVLIWQQPLMTAGGGSFIGDLVHLAGGTNIAESLSAYPLYAPERLFKRQPDIILTGIPQTGPLLFPGAAALTAVRRHRVYAVTGDITDRPGPRLGLGLLAVARAVHPEAFTK